MKCMHISILAGYQYNDTHAGTNGYVYHIYSTGQKHVYTIHTNGYPLTSLISELFIEGE